MADKSLVISKKEKNIFFDKLFDASTPNLNFFLMLTISSIIVTLGLLIDSATVVIGGMLIAPILYPILSLAMGIVVSDYKLMRNSAWVIIQSLFTVIVISVLIAFLMVDRQMTIGIMTQADHALIYFIIAFLSGIAAAYASSHPKMSEILPGVSIAVALIPPLAVFGIGISFFNWVIIVRSVSLFALNLLGIIFASLIVFSIMNFHDIKNVIKTKVKKEEKQKEKVQKERQKEEITRDITKIQKTLKEATEILQEETKTAKKKNKDK